MSEKEESKGKQESKKERKPTSRQRIGLLYPENFGGKTIDDIVLELDNLLRDTLPNMYIIISPLHQPDQEQKKPHYHVYMGSSGHIQVETYDNILAMYGGTKSLQAHSKKLCCRYFLHLDNPEKEQFLLPIEGGNDDLYYIRVERAEIEQFLQRKVTAKIALNMIYQYIRSPNAKYNIFDLIAMYADNNSFIKYCETHAYYINVLMRSYKYDQDYRRAEKMSYQHDKMLIAEALKAFKEMEEDKDAK